MKAQTWWEITAGGLESIKLEERIMGESKGNTQ